LTSRGSEELKAALRRSLRLIVVLIVVGVVVVNLFEQIKGPSYQAVSKVEVAATPLSEVITNTEPTFVDPQRSQDTAAALAASPEVYEIAGTQTNGRLGSANALQGATTISEVTDTDILAFTATASSASKAQQIANAVAAGYETFSARNASQSIVSTIAKLRTTLTTLSAGAQRTQLQGELNRLQLLQGATASDATIVQQAVSADQTSPAVVKDTALGLIIGLVVALIVVAIREAIDTRVRSDRDAEELLSVPVIGRLRPLPKRVKLVSFGINQSLFSDAYALLAAQLAPPKDATEGKVIAMTSAVAQEGKTSTAPM
jgi:capsular polysaccharide biosynthesis protein